LLGYVEGGARGRPGRVGSRAAAPRVCSGDCEKEQVFFTNRSLEASWVNSRFFPHRRTRGVACRRFAALFRVAGVGRDRVRDGGTSSVARVSALLPPCGQSLTCIRTNRQKAGKGFSQTGAACVVVTPHAREEAAAAATKRETKPEAAIREAAARARAPRGGRSTYRATRERGRRDQPANAPSGRAIAKNIALREKRRPAAARAILPTRHRVAALLSAKTSPLLPSLMKNAAIGIGRDLPSVTRRRIK
jgi:hypothetical protein